MTKIFCDCCGKEMQKISGVEFNYGGALHRIKISSWKKVDMEGQTTPHYEDTDICKECLVNAIKGELAED